MFVTAPISRPPALRSFDHQAIAGVHLFAIKPPGAVDEVVKRVLLLHEHAVVMPGLAHLVATADVGDDVDHATVEQTEAIAVEAGRHAGTVRAIAVKEERRTPVLASHLCDKAIDNGTLTPSRATAHVRSVA